MTEPLSDAEFKDLAERTQALADLAQHPAWQIYLDRCYADIQGHQRAILGGNLDPAKYQRECGYVTGAETMLTIPQRALEELRREAERREAPGEEAEAA